MKKFKMLGKAEMKKVSGGNSAIDTRCYQACVREGGDPDECRNVCLGVGRCLDDNICGAFGALNGTCMTMQTGQCRCVDHENGVPIQSVPWSACVA